MGPASPDFQATVIAADGFDAEKDSKALRGSMKGVGTDEKAIIKIVCARSVEQLKQIQKTYQQLFGRVLIDDLKSELSSKLEDVIIHLFMDDSEYSAYILHKSVDGAGTDESAIVEIMCTRSNGELKEIREVYKKMYKKDLMADLVGDTSGDFKRLLVSLSAADREENEADEAKAISEVTLLFNAGQKVAGTDEETFNMIFGRRSWAHLRETFQQYERIHKKSILKVIDDEFGGSVMLGLKAIAMTALEGREAYFAEQIQDSMKGLGTNDQKLIRLIVNRSNQDLQTVKVRFMAKYKKTLESWIIDDTSGDYQEALLTLVKGNH